MAGSPLGTMGGVHAACTLDSFLAMECHAVDFISWWQELITGVSQPLINQGYITVPDAPGSYLYRLYIRKWPFWQKAAPLLESLRVAEAIPVLVGVLDLDPDCPLTCFQLGFCFRATGEYEKSETFYKKAMMLAPEAGWIHSNLGRTYVLWGHEEQAKEVFWQALQLLPGDSFVLEQLEALGELVRLSDEPDHPETGRFVKRADFEKAWDHVIEAQQKDEVIQAMVTDRVKGGLVVDLGIRGFIPASHVGNGKVRNLEKYIGEALPPETILRNHKPASRSLMAMWSACSRFDSFKYSGSCSQVCTEGSLGL